LTLGGSGGTGTADEYSDVDFVIVTRDGDEGALLRELPQLAERLGPLLGCFTGEHVGEPRLLIALYGPPLLHVDLKVIAERDLDERVEDGVVLWQRGDALESGMARAPAAWPSLDEQWIEDRFWVWVHYLAGKIGRGELFECLDGLAFLRSAVLGPLIAARAGRPVSGVRRLEEIAPERIGELRATLGDHSPQACASAVHAAIALYRDLRGEVQRSRAEEPAVAYLAEIEGRIG